MKTAKQDLISVIVPVYNVKKYLPRCIDSIINQTYSNLEIILVDDESNDGSSEICDEYGKKDSRIKVVHKKNGGAADSRNEGLKLAKGDYIGFVDSDDFIYEDMYEYLYSLIKENKADMSVCRYDMCKEGESNNEKEKRSNSDIVVISRETAMEYVLGDIEIKSFVWDKLYRRELFDDIRFLKGKKMEDMDIVYRLIHNCNLIVMGNEIKYNYVQRSGSTLSSKTPDFYIDLYEVELQRYKFIKKEYPKIEKNQLIMLRTILLFGLIKEEKVEEYIRKNRINNVAKDIFNDLKEQRRNIPRGTLIRYRCFMLNIHMYRFIFRIYTKLILKSEIKNIL